MATPNILVRFTPESQTNENILPAGSRCKTGQRLMTGLYDNLNAQLAPVSQNRNDVSLRQVAGLK
jgi:hypothetical protein